MVELAVDGQGEPYRVEPQKIIALGLNYRDHIAESESVRVKGLTTEVPAEPVLFPKTPNVLIGNGEAIVLPEIAETYGFSDPRTDHEAELAIIIGKRCRNVTEADAYDVVYGYTCMNDVSQRNIQNGDRSGWFRGKSFDTFGPIGPRIVPQSLIGDPQQLDIVCRKNGKVVQQSNTRHMIFSIRQMIAFISRNFTLEAGDIILTGTPSGVSPLRPGDVVEVEIERIGILRNTVVAEATTA
ncbi:MAG TPA: fumarylacetoacetate hydrolase family protein [Spirochaetia bacterium]|nr:fumarylacetoacetate hydrolase family protein [Spirochaetia bacterium]